MYIKNLLILCFIFIFGCSSVQEKSDSINLKGDFVDKKPNFHESTKTYAIFRGTANTYCRFLEELDLENTTQYELSCKGTNKAPKIAIIGKDIKHLSEWTEDEINNSAKLILTDPLTGIPFPKGTIYFLPGHEAIGPELFRVAFENIIGVLNSEQKFNKLKNNKYDITYCHSNGCAVAQSAAGKGFIEIERLYHLGTESFVNDDLDGTIHTTFTNIGDFVTIIGLTSIFHIPYDSIRYVNLSNKGQKFQHNSAGENILLLNQKFQGHRIVKYL